MKKTFVAVMLIGLVLGPGYGFYCIFFSGEAMETVAVFELSEKPSSTNSNEMQTVPFGSETATFHFTPDMSPIGLNGKAQLYKVTPGLLQKQVDFDTRMTLNDRVIWEDQYRLSWKQKKKKGGDLNLTKIAKSVLTNKVGNRVATLQSSIKTFEIEHAGDYTLTMVQSGEKDAEVVTLDVTARRNVMLLNNSVLIPGCILFTIGILGFARTYNKQKTLQSSQSA